MKKTLKRWLASCLVVVMLLTAAPLSGFVGLELPNIFDIFASAASYSGTCGDKLTWTFDDETGELIISGTGKMFNYSSRYAPWRFLSVKTVIMGDNVTSIGKDAFRDCSSIESIIIGDNVTIINTAAFRECSSLKSVVFGNNVETIDDGAFYNSDALENIILPDSLNLIGTQAFFSCDSLTVIKIPENVNYVRDNAFGECINLIDIKFVDAVNASNISDLAFYNSGYYSDASNWENGVLYIDDLLLDAKTDILGKYVIKEGTKCIAGRAFSYCENLTSIIIPESVINICPSSFSECHRLTSITIPDSVTKLGSGAFWNCRSIESAKLSDNITRIEHSVFYGCQSLTSIVVPKSVTSIGDGAFYYCLSLADISLPDNIVSIGSSAFSPSKYSGDSSNWENDMLYIDNYLIEVSGDFSGTSIKQGTKCIASCAFSRCSKITKMVIPNGVISIGASAFDYCSNLENIVVPDSVKSIGTYTFRECVSLTNVTLPRSVIEIETGTFSGCTALEQILIPNGVVKIGDYAFKGCGSLTKLLIPDSITFIGEGAFRDCVSLESITIPDGIENISNSTFYNCDSLTSVMIPENVISIGDSAFISCDNLANITIPISVVHVSEYGFLGCYNLTDVYYDGSKNDWQKIFFGSNNDSLINATIHYGSVSQSEVITGKLAFATGSAWSGTEDYTYTYSDDFFDYDSTEYHHDLAMMSLCLEASACVPDGGWKKDASGKMVRSGDDYSGKYPANAETLLNNIGFKTWKHYGYDVKPGDDISLGYDTVACVIGSKNISDKDTVVAVVVRGAGYEAEWGGNFNIGKDSMNHTGFNKAKEGVLGYVEEFVTEFRHTFGENVKFWIVGYSRGGATANLVAAEFNSGLSDEYDATKSLGVTKKNIYCYCFETPQNTTAINANATDYNNIFSIVNPIDPVPKVAPASKGFNFKRYGVAYYLPAMETISNYNSKNGIMAQMNEVHNNIYGEDYKENFVFSEIKISLLSGVSIKENKFIGQMTFLNNLIDIVATEALEDRENYYYNYQGAVQDLMAMFLGGYNTPDTDVLIEKITKVVKDYFKNFDFISFHPIEALKEDLAKVISDNTEVSYADTMTLLSQIDDLIKAVINHPNYTYTTVDNADMLFYPHYGNVLVGWMAYLETVPETTRNQLLSKSLRYRTVKVNCPVDVNVYDSENNLVASVIDDEVVSVDGEYLSTYIDENGQKCIVMPFDEEYRIEVTAREDCEVTCSISETDGETLEEERIINYYEIELSEDETVTCTAEDEADVVQCDYPIINDKGEQIDADEVLEPDEIEIYTVSTESNIEISSIFGGGAFTKGEFAQVNAIDIDGYTFDGWYIDNVLVTKANEYRFCVLNNVNLKAVYYEIPVEPEVKGSVHSVNVDDIEMNYKDSTVITPYVSVDDGVDYTVTYSSSDPDIAYVDENGNVTATGTGSATITCTVTDEYGNVVTDTCEVKVSYAWWQWIIVIVLFGWIWY